MANQLSSNTLFGGGYQNFGNLADVKGNTPFEYYTNDTEFIGDAKSCAAFVAQRLGVGGTGNATTYITDLTVYAAFEEAVTTYGNMVYQYKIRDNYINLEGGDTLPFVNNSLTLVNSNDIASPVYWSDKRTATWNEIKNDAAYSQSAVDGEIFVISASISDFIAPDLRKLNNFNLATYDVPNLGPFALSTTILAQFNKFAGNTVKTINYSSSYTTFDTTDLAIFSSSPGSSSFSITASNGTTYLSFVITASTLPSDTPSTFYIATGSTANETANNIANKISAATAYYGITVTSITGSTPVQLELSSSFGSTVDPSVGFEINWLDNTSAPQQVVFSQPGTWDTFSIPDGKSFIYLFTTDPSINGTNTSLFPNGSIPTIYPQDNFEGKALNGRLIRNNQQMIINIAEGYAQMANIGGFVTQYTGSIDTIPFQQYYDLNAWAAASASLEPGDRIQITELFYQEPPAIVRYFDPYAGTGTGVQGLLETFGFGSYSPGINFMLMPVYWDIQKIQAIEFNDQVRKSAFSFNLVNNQLQIFPIPTDVGPQKLFFKYTKVSDQSNPLLDSKNYVISDVMNVPYRNPIYSNINQVGRMWIFRYTLALCKEIEGQIRATFQGSNFGGLVVNGSELLTDSRTEKTELMAELKEMLNEVSRRAQLERKQQESDFTRNELNNIPLLIYAF